MTEDTRQWANANAKTPEQLGTAITDFNAAQRWAQEGRRGERSDSRSKSLFERVADDASMPQTSESAS